MDFSSLTAMTSAISLSKDLASAALGVRDFTKIAPIISELNNKLLAAQSSLLVDRQALLALQEEKLEMTEKLRKMEESLAERERYTLIELSTGVFVQRVNATPVDGHVGDPIAAEPLHYVCQPCLSRGFKVVLQRQERGNAIVHYCSGCKAIYLEKHKPTSPTRTQRLASDEWTSRW